MYVLPLMLVIYDGDGFTYETEVILSSSKTLLSYTNSST